jgi:hypothetical protein
LPDNARTPLEAPIDVDPIVEPDEPATGELPPPVSIPGGDDAESIVDALRRQLATDEATIARAAGAKAFLDAIGAPHER